MNRAGPVIFVAGLVLAAGCSEGERAARGEDERPVSASQPRVEPSSPEPSASHPLRRGFTQRPPRDAPGLPPLPEPFLTPEERASLPRELDEVAARARAEAETEILESVRQFEARGEVEDVGALATRVREHAREGRIEHMSANDLFEIYMYPNDADAANARYRGRPVVLTGRVAPHNMTDPADGFKLFEQAPYAHEPVLLETEQELVFVRCRLARPEIQKLRDWQEIHVLGIVDGKDRGDVVLEGCVVLG